MSSIKEKSFLGIPVIFGDYIALIKPMTVGEKVMLENKYNYYLSLLCMSDSDIEDMLTEKLGANEVAAMQKVTPFEYLLLSADYNETFLLELQKAFSTFLKEQVRIIPKAQVIFVGEKMDDKRVINANNFEEFQNILRIQNHLETPEVIPENEDPMHKKFRLRRKQVKEAKAKQNAKKGEVPEFIDLISSLCSMGIGVTWDQIKDMPVFTFYELVERNQKKEKYDIDIRSILAGADPKKVKPKYWISKSEEN